MNPVTKRKIKKSVQRKRRKYQDLILAIILTIILISVTLIAMEVIDEKNINKAKYHIK